MTFPLHSARMQVSMKWLRLAALALCLLLCAADALAQPGTTAAPLQFDDAAEDRRFHALVQELRCVKCQNQSLADSNAQIAIDLRREVLTLMREGRSDTEIKQFLVARYGEFVLYRPRVERMTWLLWFGPGLVLLAGAVVIALRVKRGGRLPAAPADDDQEW